MPKRKAKRAFRTITFKVFYDTDQDVMDWWEHIDEGDRSDTIRDLIREHLGIQPKARKAKVFDLPELLEVRRDTLWIKDAINDMPAYFEQLIKQVAGAAAHAPRASPQVVRQDKPALTEDAVQRRADRIRSNTSW